MKRFLRISLTALLIVNFCPCGFVASALDASSAQAETLQAMDKVECHAASAQQQDLAALSGFEDCCDDANTLNIRTSPDKQPDETKATLSSVILDSNSDRPNASKNLFAVNTSNKPIVLTPIQTGDRLLI